MTDANSFMVGAASGLPPSSFPFGSPAQLGASMSEQGEPSYSSTPSPSPSSSYSPAASTLDPDAPKAGWRTLSAIAVAVALAATAAVFIYPLKGAPVIRPQTPEQQEKLRVDTESYNERMRAFNAARAARSLDASKHGAGQQGYSSDIAGTSREVAVRYKRRINEIMRNREKFRRAEASRPPNHARRDRNNGAPGIY